MHELQTLPTPWRRLGMQHLARTHTQTELARTSNGYGYGKSVGMWMAQLKHGGGSGHNEAINAEINANTDEQHGTRQMTSDLLPWAKVSAFCQNGFSTMAGSTEWANICTVQIQPLEWLTFFNFEQKVFSLEKQTPFFDLPNKSKSALWIKVTKLPLKGNHDIANPRPKKRACSTTCTSKS